MPAYATRIPEHSCRQCGRRATYEVFNARNATCGFYCARHQKPAVDDLNRLDAALETDRARPKWDGRHVY